MKSMKKVVLPVLPLLLGLLSFLTFVIYLYSANHAPYRYTDIIILGPIFSLLGIIISIANRKNRKLNPTLWISGLVICSMGFLLCLLVFILLMAISYAMMNGH